MFCYQCEQSVPKKRCTSQGVCGKKADTANLQDELINALVELAICNDKTPQNTNLLIDGLFITITNVNYDNEAIKQFIDKVEDNINCDF